MPCLTTVEACPSIGVVVGDLAGAILRGLVDILASELGIRVVRPRGLRLGPVLHGGL